MPHIAIIGAGSTVFMRRIVADVLQTPALKSATIALHDIDAGRLDVSEQVARRMAEAADATPTIFASTDRVRCLDGADFVILMIQVGGYEPCTVTDFEVPKKYGLRQTIGDTLGVGGIMRGLRTAPVLLDIAADMRRLCPDALMLQYVNPMAINCWALARLAPDIKVVGLCHSVQLTAMDLAEDLGEAVDDIAYECAGINHMAFYTRFEKHHADGHVEDLYPRLQAVAANGGVPDDNRVRYELLKRTGYFVTESSEHFAEYVPWFIKRDRPDLIERFNIPLDEYPRRCEAQVAEWQASADEVLAGKPLALERSCEFAAAIMEAATTGVPYVFNGNVPNAGLIDNLPADACVEVPCTVDRTGVHPHRVGALPPHLTAMMQTQINVQSLVVEALATGKRKHVYHAAMLDPHTAAELDLDQIWALVDDLIAAHGNWMPALR